MELPLIIVLAVSVSTVDVVVLGSSPSSRIFSTMVISMIF